MKRNADDPPRGWYPDPDPGAPPEQRWHQEVADPQPPNGGWVRAGYVFAVLLPIVGFFIGVILGAKGNRHAPWVLILSVGMVVIWLALLY